MRTYTLAGRFVNKTNYNRLNFRDVLLQMESLGTHRRPTGSGPRRRFPPCPGENNTVYIYIYINIRNT